MEALSYPPHITLAIYDEVGISELLSAFEFAMDRFERIRIRFEKLGYFEETDRAILWAVPDVPNTVRIAQKQIHTKIDPKRCRPQYRPDSWVPHCSLATTIALSRKTEAIALVNRPLEPFEVVFDVADCVSFLPVRVIHEKELPGFA